MRTSTENLLESLGLTSTFNILYSTTWHAHDLSPVLYAISNIYSNHPQIRFVCVANGKNVASTRSLASSIGIDSYCLFKPLVPSRFMPDTMGLADIGIVSIRPAFDGVVVPSKFAGYLARGIPILYVGPQSDITDILSRSGAGVSFTHDDIDGISDFLHRCISDPSVLKKMSSSALSYYNENLSVSLALNKYLDLAKLSIASGI